MNLHFIMEIEFCHAANARVSWPVTGPISLMDFTPPILSRTRKPDQQALHRRLVLTNPGARGDSLPPSHPFHQPDWIVRTMWERSSSLNHHPTGMQTISSVSLSNAGRGSSNSRTVVCLSFRSCTRLTMIPASVIRRMKSSRRSTFIVYSQ